MKRNISVIILTALLTANLVSCGSADSVESDTGVGVSQTAGEESTLSTETAALTDNLPDTDMSGFEMRFYNYDDSWLTWSINPLDAAEQTGDLLNDAIYVRNSGIEERFNASISETAVASTHDNLTKLILAGEDFADTVMMYDETIAKHYASGELLPWNDMPYLDLKADWWNQDADGVFTIAGQQFAAMGDFSLSMYSRGFVVVFNKDMYKSAGFADDIYSIVSGGAWTFDKFGETAKAVIADLNGDGTMDKNDRYGIVGALKQVQGSFVSGGDVKYIETDSDGIPYFAIEGNERSQNVMRRVLEVFAADTVYFNPVSDIHNGATLSRDMFFNDQALFVGTSTKGISYFRDMDEEIGIIPFPKYEEAQENYCVLTSGGALSVLPATLSADRYDNVCILLEALAFDSHQTLLKTYQETVLKTKYSRDAESEAMLDIIFDSAFFDLGLSTWPSLTYYVYMEKVYAKNEDVIASVTESAAPKVAAELEKFIDGISGSEG